MVRGRTSNLFSTAFPYLGAVPHLGNLSQAIRGDIFTTLSNAFQDDTKFPYSFHLTGLPVFLKLNSLLMQWDRNPDQGLKMDLLARYGLKHLEILSKNIGLPRTLEEWYPLFRDYYVDLFQRLGIKSTLSQGLTHTTTDLDPGYSRFLNQVYQWLNSEGKIREGSKSLIVCQSCGIILGDHQRSKGQGLGIVCYQPGGPITSDLCMRIKAQNPNPWVRCDNLQGRIDPLELQGLTTTNLEVLSGQIRCRCGNLAKIRVSNTMFWDIDDQWKDRAISLVNSTPMNSEVRKIILKSIGRLRPLSFLRSQGYGSRLDILRGTSYEDQVVDPLGDSPIHQLYFLKLLGFINGFDPEAIVDSPLRSRMYLTGVDLVPTHLVYMVMICALPRQPIPLPYFCVNGYLVGPDSQKMSKSKGNVIYWDHLQEQGVQDSDLRFFLASLSDDISGKTRITPDLIKSQGYIGKRHASKLKTRLGWGWTDQTYQVLSEIRREVRPWEYPPSDQSFRLRRVRFLLFHRLIHTLVRGDTGVSRDIPLVSRLISAFLTDKS